MKIKIKKELPLCIALFLITMSWSNYIIDLGLSTSFEYIGLFLILIGIYMRKDILKYRKLIYYMCFVLLFFSIGLFRQDLLITKKISLFLSMFLLASIAIVPCKYIRTLESLHGMSKAVMSAIICSTVLALLSGQGITMSATEGLFVRFGFDAGMEHRNYCAYMLLCVFIIEYIMYSLNFRYKDKKWLYIIGSLLLMTNSRSSWIILVIFLIIVNVEKIRVSNKKGTIILAIMLFFMIVVGIPAFQFLRTHSETFFFRLNGLSNYLATYNGNWEVLIYGNAEMAYRDSGYTYDENIRSVIGWDGSTELVILNILIKNGLIGFIGYFLIFRKYIQKIRKIEYQKYSLIAYGVVISFAISALVESYVANINHLYTIFTYLILCNLEFIKVEEERRII